LRKEVEFLLAKSLGVLAVTGSLKGLVEGERHITGDGEVVKSGVGKSLWTWLIMLLF
jgi:hypothetical protein